MDDANRALIERGGDLDADLILEVVEKSLSTVVLNRWLNEARSEGRKAADTALSERVAELERGLEPFALAAHAAETTSQRDGEVVWRAHDGVLGKWITILRDDFRQARALLNPSEGEAGT